MRQTIKQALQQGVTAHNKGNLQEAKRLYQIVLQAQPEQLDANHNLGLIAVSMHQSAAALPLLKTALDLNPKIEKFWISYINALLNLDQLDSAEKFIKKANRAGFIGKKIQTLSERLLSPVKSLDNGKLFQARDGNYLEFLRVLHENIFEGYFEIGTRKGDSLALSQSPSIAIDPFFQLQKDPIGKKDFCLFFQETSDSFFKNTLPNFPNLRCQLAFIDGMHLFEYALRDFINLAKISSDEALFLFHDPIPWSYKMATRDNKSLGRDEAWTGDIWKLVPILMDAGMKENINLLTLAPSGILAILKPEKKLVAKLEENYDKICAQYIDVELNQGNLLDFYERDVFIKSEKYLRFLEEISFGKVAKDTTKEWVSQ